MGDESRRDEGASPTPPWERARRWSSEGLEVTRVDDLLARLGTPDVATPRRRRRAEEEPEGESAAVPAEELIAALGPADPEEPAADGPAAAAENPDESPIGPEEPAADGPAAAAENPDESPAGPEEPTADGPAAAAENPDDDEPESEPLIPAAKLIAALSSGGPISRTENTENEATPIPAADLIEALTAAAAPEKDGADGDTSAEVTAVLPAQAATHTGGSPAEGISAEDATVVLPVTPLAGPVDDATQVLPKLDDLTAEPDAQEILRSLTESAGVADQAAADAAPRPPHRGRVAAMIAGRSVVALLSALILVATGTYNYVIARGDDTLAENRQEGVIQTQDVNIVQPTLTQPTAEGVVYYPPENILLLGSDSRAGANEDMGGGPESDSAQSDTLMIAHLSADRQRVQVLQFPRDLSIEAPDNCHGWDFRTGQLAAEPWPVLNGERWKVTNAYSVGGPNCTVLALQKLTGIRIDRVIGIDFKGFADMVDALDGIEVNICGPMEDAVLGTLFAQGGQQTIDGQQALNLVRARKVRGDQESDGARVQRQQKVLSTILRQVNDTGTLLNPGRMDDFLQAFARNTFTSNVTMDDLVALADSLGDLSPGKVTFYTLPMSGEEDSEGRTSMDEEKAAAVFDAIINDLPLPDDAVQTVAPEPTTSATSSAAAPTTTSEPSTVTVQPGAVDVRVWNVSGRAGVAGQAQELLNGYGFDVTDEDLVRDDDNVQDEITVLFAEPDRAQALTVLAAVPGARGVVDDSLAEGEIRLMLGTSFDGDIIEVSLGESIGSVSESTASTDAPTTPETALEPDPEEPESNPWETGPSTSATLNSGELEALNASSAGCI